MLGRGKWFLALIANVVEPEVERPLIGDSTSSSARHRVLPFRVLRVFAMSHWNGVANVSPGSMSWTGNQTLPYSVLIGPLQV